MEQELPFIPGQPPKKKKPLSRYLPPLPEGVVTAWLSNEFNKIGVPENTFWVLDPFGASPSIAIEAAQAGYKVLVFANNPVTRFLIEMFARPPSENEIRAALADLAASFKGEDRIEPHIRSLYTSKCVKCMENVEVETYIWDRDTHAPISKIYSCKNCGENGEVPVTQDDINLAARLSSNNLHRARALERVASINDPDRVHAEEAIDTYLPRSIYVLFTLINKLDSLPSSRKRLTALLLTACDQATSLWPFPTQRARPRQLIVPARFRENNIWLALEEAVQLWSLQNNTNPVPVTIWPEEPPEEGGICLYEGRLKDLIQSITPGEEPSTKTQTATPTFKAVLCALPRPNQAFWTLSALWAGWLWGREASAPFKSVLRRRRFDWAWNCMALHSAFENLKPLIQPGTPILGLIGEAEQGFITSTILAGDLAGFKIKSMAIRAEEDQAQIQWENSQQLFSVAQPGHEINPIQIATFIREAAILFLQERGEPSPFLPLLGSGLMALTTKQWKSQPLPEPVDLFNQIQTNLQQVFTYRGGFSRFGGSDHSLEIGKWWLRETSDIDSLIPTSKEKQILTLSDRIEMEVVRELQDNPGLSPDDLDRKLCQKFPGIVTPERELVYLCLESYGEERTPGSNLFYLREQDHPASRRRDLDEMRILVKKLGEKLGYTVNIGLVEEKTGRSPIFWIDPGQGTTMSCYILASAHVYKLFLTHLKSPSRNILIIPGSRSGLINYKIQHDPRLNLAVESSWYFLKYRQVRMLVENDSIHPESLEKLFSMDPLEKTESQISLF